MQLNIDLPSPFKQPQSTGLSLHHVVRSLTRDGLGVTAGNGSGIKGLVGCEGLGRGLGNGSGDKTGLRRSGMVTGEGDVEVEVLEVVVVAEVAADVDVEVDKGPPFKPL